MTTYDDLVQAAAALADPATSSRDLMSIAQAYPSLWVDVARHPNAYPDLLSWLSSVGDDSVREAIAARVPSTDAPADVSPPPPPPVDEQSVEASPVGAEIEENTEPEGDLEPVSLETDNPAESEATTSNAEGSIAPDTEDSNTPDAEGSITLDVEEGSIDFQTPESSEGSSTLVGTASSIPENPTHAAEPSSHKPSWASTPKGKKILIGSGAGLLTVILAVVLIITLVVIPRQRAEEAAAAEQVRLEQEHQAAVDAFTKASDDCTQANESLATAISHAQQTATLDPSTLNDPALIYALNQAIATAQAVKNCVPLTMADDTATILKQTTDMTTEISSVTTASSSLTDADQSASRSYQTKANQEAAAKAAEDAKQKAEQEAASQAVQKGDFTITDKDGYTYRFAFDHAVVTTSIDTTQGKPGNVLLLADMNQTKLTITNITSGKTAPGIRSIRFTPIYLDNPCAISDIAGGCQQRQIGAKEYWTVSDWYIGWSHWDWSLSEYAFDVNGSWTNDWSGVDPDSIEVPQGVSKELANALSSPAAFIVYDPTEFYQCASDQDSLCFLGGSESLK